MLKGLKRLYWLCVFLAALIVVGFSMLLIYKCALAEREPEQAITGFIEKNDSIKKKDAAVKKDLSDEVEVLGQPFALPVYARNIWDMQQYNGRIYLGCGNYYNDGPDPNAGPVPVVYYDTLSGTFVTQTTLDEEQIDIFKILDGKLVIPGIDPKDDWSYGNFYTLEDDVWVKTRSIPNGLHNFDMAYSNGYLYAAIGTGGFGSAVRSPDMGKSWESLTKGELGKAYSYDRSYSVFTFKDKLYFTGVLYRGFTLDNKFLCVGDEVSTIYAYNMIPGAIGYDQIRMYRINEIEDKLIYISIFNIGSEWLPDALYTAKSINRTKRIRLPERDAVPMDILTRDNKAYLLASALQGSDEYINIVYSSEDMYNWNECFRFSTDTFARSFEEFGGYFYFGLGCYTDYLTESSGTVLRIKG